MRSLLIVLVMGMQFSWPVMAQPGAAPPESRGAQTQPPAQAAPRADIGRTDLALAYLRFERAYLAAKPAGQARTAAHQAFDQASLRFFAQQFAEAIRDIDRAAAVLAGAEDAGALAAMAHRARFDPPTFTLDAPPAATVTIDRLYDIGAPAAADATLVLRDAAGKDVFTTAVTLPAADDPRGAPRPITPNLAGIAPGVLTASLKIGDGPAVPTGRWLVVAGSLDAARTANENALAAIKDPPPPIAVAAAIAASRNALLMDRPPAEMTAAVVLDLSALAADVSREVAALGRGENPYRKLAGDHWRSMRLGSTDVAMRVFVPPAVVAAGTPAPVVVALHGAGGDENMFMDAYGGGMLKRLAEERGFIAVSPATLSMAGPATFAALVDAIAAEHPVDRARVYVLGHSLGAGVAFSVARGNAPIVAAAACLAGPGRMAYKPGAAMPATLVVAADLDPLIPISRLRPSAEQAIADGAPLEFRAAQGAGHTLVVTDELPATIEWLLARRLGASSPAGADVPQLPNAPGVPGVPGAPGAPGAGR